MFQTHLMRARLFFRKTVSSAWFVDSAIRWRCNGAGGLRKIVVRLRLFAAGFLSFCGFAIRSVARAASLPARRLAASAVAGLTPAGCVRFEHLFPPPFCVAASCIFQSAAEFANNSVVCHSEEIGRSTKNLYQMFRFAQHDVAASMPHIAAISLVRKSRCQGCNPCARARLALKARPPQPARASTRRRNTAD